jgi:hypothetical protein
MRPWYAKPQSREPAVGRNAATPPRGRSGPPPCPRRASTGSSLEVLRVEQRDARVAVAIRRIDRIELAEQRADVLPLRVPPAEVLVEDAGPGHGIEGRVRDEAVDLPAHEQALLAVDHRPLHRARTQARVHVADEGVLRLVVVVVGVEGEEAEVCHLGGLLLAMKMNDFFWIFNERICYYFHIRSRL